MPAQNIRDNRQQLQQPPNQQSQPLWNLNSPLVRSPEACYDDVSLYYFIRRFVSPNPVDGFPGHLSFLPGLYDTYSHGLLETATLSVAQMAAYNKFGGEKFKVESYRNYGRAIKMIQNIIKTEDQATDDKVIASILLLCALKDISGEESGNPNEHAPGLYYLIEKRGPEQIATSRGAELLFLALIRLVSLVTRLAVIFLSTITINNRPTNTSPSKFTLSYTRILHTVTLATLPPSGAHLTHSSVPCL